MTSAPEFDDRGALASWQLPLLPAGVLAAGSVTRTPRDWAVDLAMLSLTAAFGAGMLAATSHSALGWTVAVGAGVVALGALWARRRHPWGVAVVVLAMSTVSGLACAAALPAAFNAALRLDGRRIAFVAALAFATQLAYSGLYHGADVYDWTGLVIGILLTAIAISCGLFVRAQRDLVRSLRAHARSLEAERRLHRQQARMAERRRIAREMHDVLAHNISLLSVHAGALEFRPDASPERISHAASVVRRTAGAALRDLRDVIGALRDEEAAGAATARLQAPQPAIADLPSLVQQSRDAGARVALRVDVPDLHDVAPLLGRTVYRVVQEGLTNARKHAPGTAVEVDVTDAGETLTVVVVNRRPLRAAGGHGDRLPGAGAGLIGLSERVSLSGGTLSHGPGRDGDFVLTATLPRR